MICQICNEKPASIQITIFVNGNQVTLHLCEDCAKRETANAAAQFDLTGFINGLLNIESKILNTSKENPQTNQVKCGVCGMTFEQFRKTGKLGCDECYETFGELLEPLIKRIHGRSVHTGKVPKGMREKLSMNQELTQMQKQLEEAIQTENYELAAEYRDIIRLLKSGGNPQEAEERKQG